MKRRLAVLVALLGMMTGPIPSMAGTLTAEEARLQSLEHCYWHRDATLQLARRKDKGIPLDLALELYERTKPTRFQRVWYTRIALRVYETDLCLPWWEYLSKILCESYERPIKRTPVPKRDLCPDPSTLTKEPHRY